MIIHGLSFPDELHYLVEHDVWARLDADGLATVGIAASGIKLSGEIYMCRPRPVGTEVVQRKAIGVVELAKAIVSVKCAISGTVVAVNPKLEVSPELVHLDPYGEGWIARLLPNNLATDRTRLVQGEALRAAMQCERP